MKVPSELISDDGHLSGTCSSGTPPIEGVSRKAQPDKNHRAHSPHRLTIRCLPCTEAFLLAQSPPGQSQLRLRACHNGTSVTSSFPSPHGCNHGNAPSHFLSQSHIPRQSLPFQLRPASSPCSVLCRTTCIILQRHPWGLETMNGLRSPCQLEQK